MQIIAGPCVIESERLALGVAAELASIADRLGVEVVYKSSFDKANRTSVRSYRGPGFDEGLAILDKVRSESGLRTITDVHETAQIEAVSQAVDMLQIPAFLCRQTDLLQAAIETGKRVLAKKGQFMAPEEMAHVVQKAQARLGDGPQVGERLILCERGSSFGYGDLVVDMRSLEIMRDFGCPVFFDASHSVQKPAAGNNCTVGDREMTPVLARAAAAAGIDGLFIETHPDPDLALSDAATVWPLDRLEVLLEQVLEIDQLVRLNAENTSRSFEAFG